MGLPDLVRGLIAGPVTSIAGGFRASVGLNKMIGRDAYGPKYDPTTIPLEALVELDSEQVAAQDGTQKVSSAHFTFYGPVNIAEGDHLTVNGIVMTIVKVGGLLDETGKPYLPEAWTGK